ncbi:MKI67 FHA domain-interacting nucleolar phosphoprotein-like [Harpegnathos saltator]|uniref:MKI67 FHA domain-interacting nucleolar phosphoprotein-like n=1 Tax=Harpegnathos saltator TaxID=610380 RepID=E2BLE1_HARSA|nr:MKI67 FHA domain-interacting nucleolar phosphoprotein-like [Harpegnathos saltator]EFN83493.1 MKI67 FHA domain-interacting nucleolar phosphoprotein-like [Harpegnathos saltator]
MKVTKKSTVSFQEPVLRKVAKSKRKTSTPKAGVSLEKAVKNVQQIFKKENTEIKTKKKPDVRTKPTTKSKSTSKTISKATSLKEKRPQDRGIVYIGHIPHGFYEEQMRDYFKQFGKVTRVRVARSKRTGRSRGYGYIEFMHKDVAKVAANTMHNYLMCGRLLKATYIPPEKQHPGFFLGFNWSEDQYPKLKNRRKVTTQRNNSQSTEDYKNFVKSSLSKLSALEGKLQKKGISIKFQAVDVPQL